METNQNNTEIVFTIPDGYEQDKKSSTDKQIVFKHKQIDVNKEIREFLFEIFDGLIIDLKRNKDYIFYKKNNCVYLQYDLKNKCLYYDYYKIYSILKSNYQLEAQSINKLVKDMVYETLELKVNTTNLIWGIGV
jgi:hypothetical protein